MPLHAAATARDPKIAVLLGIVEGLTEYLPISSTGHLVLVGHLLGLSDDDPATSSFEIVVQLGAILAVVAHYWTLLGQKLRGLAARDAASFQLLTALAVAFAPTAVAGLLLRKTIKARLFGPIPVTAALVVGGVAMILIERWVGRRNRGVHPPDTFGSGEDGLDKVTPKRALAVGLGQCLSLWPALPDPCAPSSRDNSPDCRPRRRRSFRSCSRCPRWARRRCSKDTRRARTSRPASEGLSLAVGLVVSFFVAWAVIASFLEVPA